MRVSRLKRLVAAAGPLLCALAVFWLFLSSPNAGAASSFPDRLDEAIRQVEAAIDRDAPLADPAPLFPEHEEIPGPQGGALRVDHASLRDEWNAVPLGGAARREALARLRQRLIAVRVETSGAAATAEPPSGWREKLATVLASPDFKKRETTEDWRMSLMKWLAEKLGFLLPRVKLPTTGLLAGWVLYALAGGTLVAALVVLLRAALPLFTRRRAAPQSVPTAVDTPESATSLLALADARTRSGDLRGAAQAIFRWMLVGLQQAGRLPYDPALTNREHLNRLRADAGVRATFERVASQFDLVWYGCRPITSTELTAFRADCVHLTGGRE